MNITFEYIYQMKYHLIFEQDRIDQCVQHSLLQMVTQPNHFQHTSECTIDCCFFLIACFSIFCITFSSHESTKDTDDKLA